jgi:hypothetical protein
VNLLAPPPPEILPFRAPSPTAPASTAGRALADHESIVAQVRAKRVESASQLEPVVEKCEQLLSFNVMPARPVTETLEIERYRVAPGFAQAEFSRRYSSAMKKSPSHLIFLSALVQMQKLAYLAVGRQLGLRYEPGEAEQLKIWPTRTEVFLPRMVRDEEGLVQTLSVDALEPVADRIFKMTVTSEVSGLLSIAAEAKVYLL